jgi:hypothetical protein
MSEYCPVGKIECEHFDNGINEDGLFCRAVDLPLDIYLIEVCPYPSRQVPAEPPLQISMSVNQYNESLRNAKLFTIQKCREAVLTAMADWSNVWCVADAAISAVEREIK